MRNHKSRADSLRIAAPKTHKARISNGNTLLPTVDGRSLWARLMRDAYANLVSHCGGIDNISETKRLAARRIAALEAELIHMEDQFALSRASGDTPDVATVHLYSTISNTQRRLAEALGWQRTARDVFPTSIDMDRLIDAVKESTP